MGQDQDQYVHFTIKLLKGSFALKALWQDALNYHMIDQPDKLIALRLTEYYELVAKGGGARPSPGGQGVPVTPTTRSMGNGATPQPQANANARRTPSQPLQSQRAEKAGE